jgi:hypothetical protein
MHRNHYYLSVGEDVWHDGERGDESDAHVPLEVGQKLVERIAKLTDEEIAN